MEDKMTRKGNTCNQNSKDFKNHCGQKLKQEGKNQECQGWGRVCVCVYIPENRSRRIEDTSKREQTFHSHFLDL